MKLILKAYAGSKLYGTDTPLSDTDYVGLYHKDDEFIFGLENQEQIKSSTGNNTSANTAEDIDCTYYSVHEFIRLALKCNPNILELFFIPEDKIIEKGEYFSDYAILKAWKNFLITKRIFKSFFGYANAQRHLLETKTRRYYSLQDINKYLENALKYRDRLLQEDVDALSKMQYFGRDKKAKEPTVQQRETFNQMNKSPERKYVKGQPIDQIKEHIQRQVEAYGSRKLNIEQFGFECKFASHLIRLIYEGISLAKDKEMIFPLPEEQKKKVLAIKNGEMTLQQVLDLYEGLYQEFKNLEENSTLPADPDFHSINREVISLTKMRIDMSSLSCYNNT